MSTEFRKVRSNEFDAGAGGFSFCFGCRRGLGRWRRLGRRLLARRRGRRLRRSGLRHGRRKQRIEIQLVGRQVERNAGLAEFVRSQAELELAAADDGVDIAGDLIFEQVGMQAADKRKLEAASGKRLVFDPDIALDGGQATLFLVTAPTCRRREFHLDQAIALLEASVDLQFLQGEVLGIAAQTAKPELQAHDSVTAKLHGAGNRIAVGRLGRNRQAGRVERHVEVLGRQLARCPEGQLFHAQLRLAPVDLQLRRRQAGRQVLYRGLAVQGPLYDELEAARAEHARIHPVGQVSAQGGRGSIEIPDLATQLQIELLCGVVLEIRIELDQRLAFDRGVRRGIVAAKPTLQRHVERLVERHAARVHVQLHDAKNRTAFLVVEMDFAVLEVQAGDVDLEIRA